MSTIQEKVDELGFAMAHSGLSDAGLCALGHSLGAEGGAGSRGVLLQPMVSALAGSEAVLSLVRPHLRTEPLPVRGIFFNKSSSANWTVAWHQDVTLSAGPKAELPGFGPWSIKNGDVHVQPPEHLLSEMLTIRLHLDDADESNGALRVLPGSHRKGRLSAEDIRLLLDNQAEHVCKAKAGEILLMRPLLLHASSRSASSGPRRVLHIEYAGFELPRPLRWNEAA